MKRKYRWIQRGKHLLVVKGGCTVTVVGTGEGKMNLLIAKIAIPGTGKESEREAKNLRAATALALLRESVLDRLETFALPLPQFLRYRIEFIGGGERKRLKMKKT